MVGSGREKLSAGLWQPGSERRVSSWNHQRNVTKRHSASLAFAQHPALGLGQKKKRHIEWKKCGLGKNFWVYKREYICIWALEWQLCVGDAENKFLQLSPRWHYCISSYCYNTGVRTLWVQSPKMQGARQNLIHHIHININDMTALQSRTSVSAWYYKNKLSSMFPDFFLSIWNQKLPNS